ncbi:MAG: amidohydrolase family protein [Arcicella sp.]|nr:amidohydrolase family protein [Arcicella sp.]
MNTFNKELSLEDLIEKITTNPREILRLKNPMIAEGEKANLTVFSASEHWIYQEKSIVSKSKNSPFIGTNFTGKIIKVIV